MSNTTVSKSKKRAARERLNKFLSVLLSIAMVLQTSPVAYARWDEGGAEGYGYDAAVPEEMTTTSEEVVAEAEPEPEPEPQVEEQAPVDEVATNSSNIVEAPEGTDVAEQTAEIAEQQVEEQAPEAMASISVYVENATLTIDGNQLTNSAGTLTTPEGKAISFSVAAAEGYELKEDSVKVSVDGFESALAGNGSYALDASQVKNGTMIIVRAAKADTKTEYVYEDDYVRVTATLDKASAIPDDAVLSVTPIYEGSTYYNYDAYMEALNNRVAGENTYDNQNTLLYDVAFLWVDPATGQTVELQPEEGAVTVKFTFRQRQLSDGLQAGSAANVEVNHLPLVDSAKEATTYESTDIAATDVKVEPMGTNPTSLNTLEVRTDSFSVFAFSYTVDFTYDGYTLKLEGNGSIMLSQILGILNIPVNVADIASVDFTNYDLLSFERQGDDWKVTSLRSFVTPETLTVTLTNGDKYVIEVTDPVESSSLADFLTNAVITGATQNADGAYEVEQGKDYSIILSFAENSNYQFDNDATLRYRMPAGIKVINEQSGPLKINIVYKNRTYEVDATFHLDTDGNLTVKFDESDPDYHRLEESTNVSFRFAYEAQFDGTETHIRFNELIERDIIFDEPEPAQAYTNKTATFDETTGKFNYTITVTATGDVTNVNVKDVITGNALIFNNDVRVTGNSSSYTDNGAPNGFDYTFASMREGETITITYSAGVDFSKDTDKDGKITVDQTKNTVTVKPDGGDPHNSEYSHEINFKSTVKSDGTETGTTADGDKIIEWTIDYNPLALAPAGGDTIRDIISAGSTEYMKYYGDGITVVVRDHNDNIVRTDTVSYDSMVAHSDSSWTYKIPEEDTTPYSYHITYQTVVDMEKVNGGGVAVSLSNTANGDGGGVNVGPTSEVGVTKDVESFTTEEVTWVSTLNIPEAGLTQAVVTDTLPAIWLNGRNHYDLLKDGTLQITGRLPGESYTVDTSETGKVKITFYKDAAKSQTGLQGTSGGHTITVRLTTRVDQEWLQAGYESGGYIQNHTNKIGLNGKWDDATVTFGKPGIKKTGQSLGGGSFKYTVLLSGVSDTPVSVLDTFDTSLLEVDTSKASSWDHMRIWGGNQYSQDAGRMPISYTDTSEGVLLTANALPMQEDGHYYPYYKIVYYLRLKPGVDLEQLAIANGGEHHLINTATWGDHESEFDYITEYDYLNKELLNAGELGGTNRTAKYQITFNAAKATLNGGEPMEMTDTLSKNLSIDYSSIQITTDPAGASVPYSLSGGADGTTVATYTVPDSTKVVITYDAQVVGNGSQKIVNKVSVNGKEDTIENTKDYGVAGEGDGAIASFKIVKVDGYDANKKLEGVKFKIFAENPNLDFGENAHHAKEITLTTDENGEITLDGDAYDFYFNERYHIQETEPLPDYGTIGFDYLVTLTTDMSQVDYGHYIYYYNNSMQIKNWPLEGLVVEKKVESDDAADLDKYFTFRISILNDDGTVNTDYNEKNGDDQFENGVVEFQLKNREQKMFWGFEKGTKYKVEEILSGADGNKYTTTVDYDIYNEEGEIVDHKTESDTSHSGELTQSDETIVFTNSVDSKGSLKLKKSVTINGAAITDTTKPSPADGTYEFSIVAVDGEGEALTGDAAVSKSVAFTITNGVIESVSGDGTLGADGYVQIDNLPAGKYKITEDASKNPSGVSLVGSNDRIVTVTAGNVGNIPSEVFVNDYETTQAQVHKVWKGDDSKKPVSLQVALYKNDEETPIQTVTLNEGNKWTSGVISGLPKKDAQGNDIKYRWVEKSIPAGWFLTGSSTNGILTTLTNTYQEFSLTTSYVGTKTWVGERPDDLEVKLLANGAETAHTAVWTNKDTDTWTYTFSNLPVFDASGNYIRYTAQETVPSGYEMTSGTPIPTTYVEGEASSTKKPDCSDLEITLSSLTDLGFVIIKLTSNQGYVVWTHRAPKASELAKIKAEAVNKFRDFSHKDQEYYIGVGDIETQHGNITVEYDDATKKLDVSFSASDDWSQLAYGNFTGSQYNSGTTSFVNAKTTSVSVEKLWENADGTDTWPDGATVTVALMGGDKQVATHNLTADEPSWTFENLPAKDAAGADIVYTVEETGVTGVPDNYNTTVTGSAASGFTVKNTEGKTSVSVEKLWENADGTDTWPDGATVTVALMGGDKQVATHNLTADEPSWTFENLPAKDAAGADIVYTVEETGVTGVPDNYNTTVTGSAASGFTVKNTQDTGGLKVTKRVISARSDDLTKTFTFNVSLSDTTISGTYGEMTFTSGHTTFTLSNGQSKTAENLPTGITYSVTETADANFTTTTQGQVEGSITKDATPEGTFVNSRTTGDLTLSKNLISDKAGDKDQSFVFTVTLDPAVSGEFGGMTFNSNGVANVSLKGGESAKAEGLPTGVTYTITEAAATGFEQTGITVDGEDADAATGTISTTPSTVEFKNERETGELDVTKTVNSTTASDKTKDFSFKVTLTGLDATADSYTYGGVDFAKNTETGAFEGTFTLKHGQTKSFTDLPIGIRYEVEEETEDGFVTTKTGETGSISANKATAAFINSKTEGGLTVSKSVVSPVPADKTDKTFSFTVTLDDKTITGVYGEMSFENGVATFTLKDGETKTAKGLPEGVGFTVAETPDGNFTTTTSGAIEGKITKDATPVAAFTNTRETGSLQVNKTLVSDAAADADQTFHFTVTLSNRTISGEFNQMTFESGVAEFDIKSGESKTATGLPTGITYTVTEDEAEGFQLTAITVDGDDAEVAEGTISKNASTVRFENTREKGDIKLSKALISDAAADADQEFEFTVTLSDNTISGTYGGMTFTDGVATVTLKGGEDATATGLPTGITYTITEADADGFQLTGITVGSDDQTDDGEATGVISTTPSKVEFENTRETGDLEVTKTVVSDDDNDKTKSFNFKVTLSDTTISGEYGDVTFTDGVAEFQLADGERATAEGLPTGITYTVEEEAEQGFITTKTGDTGGITTELATAAFTNSKADKPGFEKKVADVNDSEATLPEIQAIPNETWADSADHDLGDDVPFRLEAKLPSDISAYKYYELTFEDQMESTLFYNGDAEVVTEAGDYPSEVTDVTEHSFKAKVTFGSTAEDADYLPEELAGKSVYVYFTAKLGSDEVEPVYGANGNMNAARLTYTNSATSTGGGDDTETTGWDNVIVFTYKVDVTKTDQTGTKPVTGAKFSLYKIMSDGSEVVVSENNVGVGNVFSFKGLDDGKYVLKETVVPNGYRAADDITFTVTAEHTVLLDSDGWSKTESANTVSDPARTDVLTSLTGNRTESGQIDPNDINERITFTRTDEGLTATVMNDENAKATIEATKKFENWDLFPEGTQFEFTLTAGTAKTFDGADIGDGKAPMPAGEGATAYATKDVTTAKFGEIAYEVPGIYTYTINEVDGGLPGVTYDTSAHTVTVTVNRPADNNNTLKATVTYDGNKDKLEVENTFTALKEHFEVTKQLNGRKWTDEDSFTFELAAMAPTDAPMPTGDGATAYATKANGKVAKFGDIEFVKPGKYEYTITEVKPEGAEKIDDTHYLLDGVTYETSSHHVIIEVAKSDDSNALVVKSVKYDGEKSLTVTNEYAANGEVNLTATKEVTGDDWPEGAEFTFTLTDVTDPEKPVDLGTATATKGAPTAAFGAIKYENITEDSTPEYTYEVAEVVPGNATNEDGITYDEATDEQKAAGGFMLDGITYAHKPMTVKVKLTDNGDGTLSYAVTSQVEGESTVVINPTEGDPVTYMVGTFENDAYAREATVEFTKAFYGAENGKITFRMTPYIDGAKADGTTAADTAKSPLVYSAAQHIEWTALVKAKSHTVVTSPAITFYKAGTYQYLIEEVTDKAGADEATILATIVVGEDQEPTVTYQVSPYKDAEFMDIDEATFYNNELVTLNFRSAGMRKFNANKMITVFQPEIRKVLENGILAGGEFSFELRDEAGNLVSEATNDENGRVEFAAIRYEEAGEHTYTITEVAGTDSTINYSTETIELKVAVVENKTDGVLTATGTYSQDGKAVEVPTITNKYKTVGIHAVKYSREDLEKGIKTPLAGAHYGLWMVNPDGADIYLGVQESDAGGNLYYDIPTLEGVVYYFKEEEPPPAGHLVDPYPTDYFTLLIEGGQFSLKYFASYEEAVDYIKNNG